ncbi:MAG: hypothetical protein QXW97_00005, partial [Candidatus Pacearchaeota archaeon]
MFEKKKWNKRGLSKLIIFVLVLSFFFMFIFLVQKNIGAQIIEKNIFFLGEKVKLDLSNKLNYNLKINSPKKNYNFKGTLSNFVFIPEEIGNYSVEINSNGVLEKYYFDVVKNFDLKEIKLNYSNIVVDENLLNGSKIKIGKNVKIIEKLKIQNGQKKEIDIPRTNNFSIYRVIASRKESVKDFIIEENEEIIKIILEKISGDIEIEYFLPAPKKEEKIINNYTKEVKIYTENNIDYENVTAYTNLTKIVKNKENIKIFWKEENKYITDFNAFDLDNDTYLDYIEWNIPHLSNQTFEISFKILNIQSYPVVGGNWEVKFNTTGKSDLKISVAEGTTWSNLDEENDLKFLEVKCGDKKIDYQWINNSIFI